MHVDTVERANTIIKQNVAANETKINKNLFSRNSKINRLGKAIKSMKPILYHKLIIYKPLVFSLRNA